MINRLLFILFFFFSLVAKAQTTTDSLKVPAPDTAAIRRDSIALVKLQEKVRQQLAQVSKWALYPFTKNPLYRFDNPVAAVAQKRVFQGKEGLFYVAIGLIIFFALLKNNFSKYLQDLFRLFFRSTLKQRQIKDQLMEAPLPSLLFNLIFFISGALFLNLIFQHFQLGGGFNFWLLLLYSVVGLAAIYFVKFVSLKLCGWLFRLSETTGAYSFIVFTSNKIVGIALLPFIVLLSFTNGMLYQVSLTLSIIIVALLFAYRFFLSYVAVHKQVRIDFFHFILYLLAFEIAPLLLINKALLDFLR